MNLELRAKRYLHLARIALFRRTYDWEGEPLRGDGRLILFFNGEWGRPPDLPPDGLPAGCEVTTDRRRMREAAAVVFHIPSLGSLSRVKKFPGQLWVAHSRECDVHYPRLRDPAFMEMFDLTVTHERGADVVCPYYGPELEEALVRAPRPKTPERLAALFLSGRHDRSGRGELAAELMRHMELHSYGRCLRNRRLRPDRGRSTKLETIARYKFTLAFENAHAPDYVTEKFFDPLVGGSVPVYLGAPNVDEFAPGEHCYVDASDFSEPAELARHLRALGEDDEAYERLHAWRRQPLRPEFLRLLDDQRTHWIVRLFDRLAAKRPTMAP